MSLSNTSPRYRFVLFDCDGTLLNTLSDLAAAGNHVCAAHGWPTFGEEEYKLKVGNGLRVLARRIMPRELAGDEALAGQVYCEFTEYYEVHKDDATGPYPGIVEAVRSLTEAGVTCGVLTNKNQAPADELVAKYFGDLLPCVQGRVDEMPAKPEPPMTLALMARLGADPASTLMVGDTSVDIACGVNAGIDSAGVLWGFRSRDELERAGATHIVATAGELVDLVLGR